MILQYRKYAQPFKGLFVTLNMELIYMQLLLPFRKKKCVPESIDDFVWAMMHFSCAAFIVLGAELSCTDASSRSS